MPTVDLIRRARGRLGNRRILALIVTPLAAGALVLAVVTRGDGAEDGELGPTILAEPRDLATTLEAAGSLRRSDEQTVAYAAALPADGGDGTPDGQGGDTDGGDTAGDTAGDMEPISFLTEPTSSTSSTAPSATPSTTSTTDPCSPIGTSSTTAASSSTSSTTPCPTTTSTTNPTPTSTTSTTTPTSSTTPTAPPRPGRGDTPSPSRGDPGATDGSGGSDPGAAAPSAGGDTAPSGDDAGPAGDDGGEVPSAILTSLLDVGATAGRGTELYTADQEPIVALIGDVPAWRSLEEGVADGADVRQLEENLVALGYGVGLDVDEAFTADTAAAVEAWETDLGRAHPDGVVAIGDVVFLTEPGDVLGHEASVGDTLEAGSPVMTIGSEQRIVVADVDAAEAGGWTPGSTVDIEWSDGSATRGTVIGTGREVTDGQVELTVAVGTGDAGAGTRRSGAEATITLVDARRDGVLAVPVTAIVDGGGSPAVRVVQESGPDVAVPVETGLVAGGWIEITAGLDGGEEIRLPG
jgi:membrane fusion protein, multidrug efflux system